MQGKYLCEASKQQTEASSTENTTASEEKLNNAHRNQSALSQYVWTADCHDALAPGVPAHMFASACSLLQKQTQARPKPNTKQAQ
jgi:hypothetical protein